MTELEEEYENIIFNLRTRLDDALGLLAEVRQQGFIPVRVQDCQWVHVDRETPITGMSYNVTSDEIILNAGVRRYAVAGVAMWNGATWVNPTSKMPWPVPVEHFLKLGERVMPPEAPTYG